MFAMMNLQTGVRVCVLLVERAGQGVGHEGTVGHGVDVLHQVMEQVAVWTAQQHNTIR